MGLGFMVVFGGGVCLPLVVCCQFFRVIGHAPFLAYWVFILKAGKSFNRRILVFRLFQKFELDSENW